MTPIFENGETEAQKGKVTWPRSPSQQNTKLGLKPRPICHWSPQPRLSTLLSEAWTLQAQEGRRAVREIQVDNQTAGPSPKWGDLSLGRFSQQGREAGP